MNVHGHNYLVTLIDDYIRYMNVYLVIIGGPTRAIYRNIIKSTKTYFLNWSWKTFLIRLIWKEARALEMPKDVTSHSSLLLVTEALLLFARAPDQTK